MSLKIHTKTKIYASMCMDNSFSYTFKMKFKWWQCIRKININIKSLLILIPGKKLGFSLSATRQIHFFGGYLCNVTSFISLDHLNKLYTLVQNPPKYSKFCSQYLYNFKAKHVQKEYMTVTSNLFYTSFSNKIIFPEKDPECVQSELFTYVDGMRSAFSTW